MEGVPASNNYQGGFGTSLMAKVDSYDYGLLLQLNVNLVEEIGRPLFSAPGIKTALAQLLADFLAMHHCVLLSLPHQVKATQSRADQMVQKVIMNSGARFEIRTNDGMT